MSRPLVFITGASSGIGQALAEDYWRAGYALALVARRTEEIRQWARGLGIAPEHCAIYGADVALTDSVIAEEQTCIRERGLPQVVIANAGISVAMDTAEREDIDLLSQVLAVNTVGTAATFHAFVTPMRTRGSGTLVAVASVAGIRGLPGHAAYCASKAAQIAYGESLRGEMRGSGVHVVTLCPGYVDTPLTRENRYPMPFLMPAAAFARRARRAIDAKKTLAVIPWQMALVARLLRMLPNWVFDWALAGQPRKQRNKAPKSPDAQDE